MIAGYPMTARATQNPQPLTPPDLRDPIACEKMRARILHLQPGEYLEFFRAPTGSLVFATPAPNVAFAGLMKLLLSARENGLALFTQGLHTPEIGNRPAIFSYFIQIRKES